MTIPRKPFASVRRGYSKAQVDAYVRDMEDLRESDREELRIALRRVRELERHLEQAEREAARGPEAFAAAVRAKHRLVEEATNRAEAILRASYDTGAEDEETIDVLIDGDRVELLAVWADEDEIPLVDAPSTETRYQQHSAHLPRLGPAGSAVLHDIADFRSKAARKRP